MKGNNRPECTPANHNGHTPPPTHISNLTYSTPHGRTCLFFISIAATVFLTLFLFVPLIRSQFSHATLTHPLPLLPHHWFTLHTHTPSSPPRHHKDIYLYIYLSICHSRSLNGQNLQCIYEIAATATKTTKKPHTAIDSPFHHSICRSLLGRPLGLAAHPSIHPSIPQHACGICTAHTLPARRS